MYYPSWNINRSYNHGGNNVKAIILSAGIGKRLKPITDEIPKSLIKINEKTILEHQLEKLKDFGITDKDIIIITGYKAKLIRKVAGEEIKYIHNFYFQTTNSLYSLWLARKEDLENGFILLNSDIIFHKDVLNKLLSKEGNAIAVDFKKKLQDGQMNVIVENKENVIKISKKIKATDASGESVQIIKFDNAGTKIIFKRADEAIKAGHKNEFPTFIFKYIIRDLGLFAVDIDNLPWFEIDDFKDLTLLAGSPFVKVGG